jgi:hypothetical protein
LKELLHQTSERVGTSNTALLHPSKKRSEAALSINSVIEKNKDVLREVYESSKRNMRYHIAEAIASKQNNTTINMNQTQTSINGYTGMNLRESINQVLSSQGAS